MIGSDPTLVAIVVPIVSLITLGFWLGLCFWAGSHPFWRHHQEAARLQQLASRDQAGQLPASAPSQLPDPASGAAGAQRVGHG
jgi:hypothetical protein